MIGVFILIIAVFSQSPWTTIHSHAFQRPFSIRNQQLSVGNRPVYLQTNEKNGIGSMSKVQNSPLKKNLPELLKILKQVALEAPDKSVLSQQRKDEIKFVLKELSFVDLKPAENANILREMEGICSARDNEDKVMIGSFIGNYLRGKSLRSFPLFLTSLRKLNYRLSFMASDTKQRLLQLFDEVSTDKGLTGRDFNEVIGGIVTGLAMEWKDFKETTKNKLLQRLKGLFGTLNLLELSSIIFNLGKLAVNNHNSNNGDKETFVEMTKRALNLLKMEKNLLNRSRRVRNQRSCSSSFLISSTCK
jgi:hypothetical protein